MPFDSAGEPNRVSDVADSVMANFAEGQYPHLVEFATEHFRAVAALSVGDALRRKAGAARKPTARHTGDMSSKWSIASEDSILSIASRGSVLSIGSVGSVGSVGSMGSALSVCSIGSALGVGSAMSAVGLGSVMSSMAAGSVMGRARPGPPARWAGAQGLVIAALAATALVGNRRVRR